ncbi:PhzF family isomerase [Lacrimispora defluvii]|uniref:PhzF family isomerase n=1 Tax=Lacrimispora defluvii TaxID=2719233 RepID=A0ABX1VVM4_9FIRM|nr:PhzF family isomerase [Lacrimispora defluvii]NNJ31819.1 PhzF family isomerase [Lacrimispora defluvii]
MKKTYRVYQVDSFTRERFTGNPAGVVTNAEGLSDCMMLKIARELNNSETAFLFPGSDGEYDVHVRFFTPLCEVPICGHATIAAHYVRALEENMASRVVIQKTGAGILPVEIRSENGDYTITMTQGEVIVGEPLPLPVQEDILAALGIPKDRHRKDCPIAIASTGHSKVMVGITEENLLHSLKPDLAKLLELSDGIGCNGYYVFTLHPEEKALVHGRMFAPAIGIAEDPVTGNANGPLGAYFITYGLFGNDMEEFSFEAVQGEAIGRKGKILVSVKIAGGNPVQVKITGEAVTVFKTELVL